MLGCLFFSRSGEPSTPNETAAVNRAQEKNLESNPLSAHARCPALPTGDWRTRQQHGYCTPKQLDYKVREWVCSAGTYQYATANTAESQKKWQRVKLEIAMKHTHLITEEITN